MRTIYIVVAASLMLGAPLGLFGQDLGMDQPDNLMEFRQQPTPGEQLDFFFRETERYRSHSPYVWLDEVNMRYNTAAQNADSTALRYYGLMQAELYHDIGNYNKGIALANDLLTRIPEGDEYGESKGLLLDLLDKSYGQLRLYDKQIEVRKRKQELGLADNVTFYDIYANLGMYRKAMNDYIYEKKKLLDETDLYQSAVYDNDIGQFLLLDRSAATALSYFKKAQGYITVYLNDINTIKSEKEVADAERLKAIIDGNIGRSHLQLAQYEDALPYLENSIGQLRDSPEEYLRQVVVENRLGLAQAFLELGNAQKAREYLREVPGEEYAELRLKYNRLMASYYEMQADYKAEVYYLQQNMRMRDSIDRSETSLKKQQLLEIVANEELENSKQTRDELQMDLERSQARMQAQDMRINLVFISLVFTLLGFAGLVYAYLKNIKNQRLLAEQKHIIEKSLVEKDSLLKEIHHRVKNNLQMVSSLLSLQTKNTRSKAAIEALEEGKTRVKAMALIHQKLYQNDDLSVIEMQGYIESLINSVQSVYKKGGHQINITIDAEGVELDIDRAIPIGLILNELVSNSFKYAFPDPEQKGQIYIHIRKNGEGGFFEYTDNGVGMPEDSDERASNSMGIRLMRRLVNQLQSSLNIDKTSDGVRFWFHFK